MNELNFTYSLTKDEVIEYVKKRGWEAFAKAILETGSQLFTDYRTRQAFSDLKETSTAIRDAIPKIIELVESKEIRLVPGAFNSSNVFTATFNSAALLAISLAFLSLDDSLKRVGSALENIRSELALTNVAKVQGWENDGFGSHIYRFIFNEMAVYSSHDKGETDHQCHYFYVWNRDNDWYPIFEQRLRESPLGSTFGGYHKDLGAICARMSSDRMSLLKSKTCECKAIFHLLIPAYEPTVIDNPIAFHSSLFPLVISGQRHRGVDLVWFNLPAKPDELTLSCIGILNREASKASKYGFLGFMSGCIGAIGCGFATLAFPPCAPIAGPLGTGFGYTCKCSLVAMFGGVTYDMSPETPQILGGLIQIP